MSILPYMLSYIYIYTNIPTDTCLGICFYPSYLHSFISYYSLPHTYIYRYSYCVYVRAYMYATFLSLLLHSYMHVIHIHLQYYLSLFSFFVFSFSLFLYIGIPSMSILEHDRARRFITLIDEIYDAGIIITYVDRAYQYLCTVYS